MQTVSFKAGGKTAELYFSGSDSKLIVLNTFEQEGGRIAQMLENTEKNAALLAVSGLDWNCDMSPRKCGALHKNDEPFSGGADSYLELLTGEILPRAEEILQGKSAVTGIAGYSLAGLFALYALYRCDVFDRAASVSGSLWFPGFREFAQQNEMRKKPVKLYLSVGDREAKTRNRLLSSVRENTEALAEHWRRKGIDVTFELNEGNHFKDAQLRTFKGITALL